MNSLLTTFAPARQPARFAPAPHPLRRPLAALALALATTLPGAVLLAGLPATAQAQGASNAARNATPQIKSFSVQAPDRARPGDEISFRLEGSPGASARV